VGTTAPNYEFTLLGPDVGLQIITPGTGTGAGDGLRFGIDSTNQPFFYNQEATDLRFGTSATERLRITAAGNVGVGTNNPQARLHVAGTVNFTGLRTFSNATSPNVIGGYSANSVTADVTGATIGGGGAVNQVNRVTDNFGTVGGGYGNRAGDNAGTTNDSASATVGGGNSNIASGEDSTVGGGGGNTASGEDSTVGGGFGNTASGIRATVGGGFANIASGIRATVPGGSNNTAAGDFSFAAGHLAKALNQGSFVWADSTAASFSSTANDQFLIRAAGGVGIGTTAPQARLHVAGGAVRVSSNAAAEGDSAQIGERYRDNSIIAWGSANGNGAIPRSFGVSSVTRDAAGEYTITLTVEAATSAGNLVPVAIAEVDAAPTSAAVARLVTIDQVSTTQFKVYITTGAFAAVDNQFTFIVTGR
jgi:hypothetical protein